MTMEDTTVLRDIPVSMTEKHIRNGPGSGHMVMLGKGNLMDTLMVYSNMTQIPRRSYSTGDCLI